MTDSDVTAFGGPGAAMPVTSGVHSQSRVTARNRRAARALRRRPRGDMTIHDNQYNNTSHNIDNAIAVSIVDNIPVSFDNIVDSGTIQNMIFKCHIVILSES